MSPESLTRYLNAAGGFTALIVAGIGVYKEWFTALAVWLKPNLEAIVSQEVAERLAPLVALALPAALFIASLALAVRALRKRSILTDPTAFSLDRSRRDQLYGRERDIELLLGHLQDHHLVFLTGESGVGKSALLRAGLSPALRESNTLLPTYFSNYGSDWLEHLPRNIFDAIRSSLSEDERKKVGLSEIINPTTIDLGAVLDLLKKIPSKLGKVPVIFFDQFDDYQLRFRDRFVTDTGAWESAGGLRKANPFWEEIGKRLGAGTAKALFAARADNASGLFSAQFNSELISYPLWRISSDTLGQLLSGLAPESAQPPIVRDPEHGWNQLKQLLVEDLQKDGTVLPQEVRTVLLGLRQLRYLTPTVYNRIGRVQGVKAAFIRRAIAGAASAHGLDAATVLSIVRTMVVPGASESGEAKTEGRTIRQIMERIGAPPPTAEQVERVLTTLETEELVRRRPQTGSGDELWQLDHDYLAAAVLEAGLRERKWALRLEQGAEERKRAAGRIAAWRALLSPREQLAIFYEHIRGRLHYGRYRTYALLSLSRLLPSLVVIVVFGFAYVWGTDYLRTAEAAADIEASVGLGDDEATPTEAAKLLQLARAAPEIKNQVFSGLLATDGGRERAALRAVPLLVAVSGLDPARRSRRVDQLVEIARREGADVPALAHLAELVGHAEPSPSQASTIIELALNAMSGDRPREGEQRLCEATSSLVAGLGSQSEIESERIVAVASRARSLLDVPAASQATSSESPLAECLLAILTSLAPALPEADQDQTIKMLWRRLLLASHPDAYAEAIEAILAKAPSVNLQAQAEDALAELVEASDASKAAAAAQKLLPIATQLSSEGAAKVWESAEKWRRQPSEPAETSAAFAPLVAATAPRMEVSLPEAWTSSLSRLARSKGLVESAAWGRAAQNYLARLSAADLPNMAVAWEAAFLGPVTSSPAASQSIESLAIALSKRLGEATAKRLNIAAAAAIFDAPSGGESDAALITAALLGKPASDTSEATRHVLAIRGLRALEERRTPTVSAWYGILAKLAPTMRSDHQARLRKIFFAQIGESLTEVTPIHFAMAKPSASGMALADALTTSLTPAEADGLLMQIDWQQLYRSSLLTLSGRTAAVAPILPLIARLDSEPAMRHLQAVIEAAESYDNFPLNRGAPSWLHQTLQALARRLAVAERTRTLDDAAVAFKDAGSQASVRVWSNVVIGMARQLGGPEIATAKKMLRDAVTRFVEAGRHDYLFAVYDALTVLAGLSSEAEARAMAVDFRAQLFDAESIPAFDAPFHGLSKLHIAVPAARDGEATLRILAHPWTHLEEDRWQQLLDQVTPANKPFWSTVNAWANEQGQALEDVRP